MTSIESESSPKPQILTGIDLSKIKIVGDNPNKMSTLQTQSLEHSIDKWDMVRPLLVDQNLNLIDGHQRYYALKKKGIKKVDVVQKYVKDEVERILLIQAMNKIQGKHEPDLDAQLYMKVIEADEANMGELMMSMAEEDEQNIYNLIHKYNQDFKPFGSSKEEDLDKVNLDPSKIKKQVVKTGDIWILGNHRLLCGDCTNPEDVQFLLNGQTVDLLLTDPPYGVDYSQKNEFLNNLDKGNRVQKDIENDNISNYREFFTAFLRPIRFSDYNIFYVFMSGQELHHLREAMDDCFLKWGDYLVWVKNNHVLGRKDYNAKHEFVVYGWKNHHKFYGDFSTTILEYDKPLKSDLHPVMKPIELLNKLIRDGSQKNMLVYDPFLGSGSTLIACEQTERRCYGIEIDPLYCQVIIERWQAYTHKQAYRESDSVIYDNLL